MQPDVRDRWADALESGEYKQGYNALCRVTRNGPGDFSEAFCCLGVLLEEESGGEWVMGDSAHEDLLLGFRKEATYTFHSGRGAQANSSSLPRNFRQRVGLGLDDIETLIELNDAKKANFRRIAAWIRKNL